METIDILFAVMTVSMFMFILMNELTHTKLINNLFAKIVIYFAIVLCLVVWISMMVIIIYIIHH